MRFALFLLVLSGACAPTQESLASLAETVSAPVQAALAQSVPAPPVAPQPTTPPPAPVVDTSFEAWRAAFIDKAVAKGFDRGFVTAEMATATLNPKILTRDTAQPEFSKPVSDYIAAAVSPARVAEGMRRRDAAPWMSQIEPRYGVPANVVVAIWGQESGFGKVQGDNDVLSAFATLAFDGRRRAWAEDQLIDCLTILRDRHIPRARLKGSWAGAMGQTQFIPSAYLQLGQDGDGDGKIDIWSSDADAVFSAANHLAQEGWKRGESWAVEVTLPAGFDYSLSEGERQIPAWWGLKGVRRADGRPWSAADAGEGAMLLVPAGASGPAFLAFPNHFVIRKYNNSIAYALSIGLMADALGGAPPLLHAWPKEIPLSREQRTDAQAALQKLGFPIDKVDGLIGAGTRAAVRQWQASKGLVADGYLTPELVERLRAQAGITPPTPVVTTPGGPKP